MPGRETIPSVSLDDRREANKGRLDSGFGSASEGVTEEPRTQ
jgi:hypothetical protein